MPPVELIVGTVLNAEVGCFPGGGLTLQFTVIALEIIRHISIG
jgi:hypothetical protein